MFPRWWDKKNTVQYVPVTIFRLSRVAGDLDIVIPTSTKSQLEIMWDDVTESFKFPIHRGVDRVGIYAASDPNLLQEYQFSRIAGGSVLKRSLANLPAPLLGTAVIDGPSAAEVGISEPYAFELDGNAPDAVYSWTTTDSTATLTNADTANVSVVFGTAGSFDVTCTVTSVLSSDSPVSDTKSVTCS